MDDKEFEKELEEYSNFLIKDGADDKKYFTIIPNYVLESELTPSETYLYLQIKKVAGEKGECYLSRKSLCEKAKISNGSLSRSLRRLCDNGFISPNIKKQIKTKGGLQYVGTYFINDIWALNNFEMSKQKRVYKRVPPSDLEGIQSGISNKNLYSLLDKSNKEGNETSSSPNTPVSSDEQSQSDKEKTVFSLADEIKKLEDNPRRELNIIALYIEERKISISNKGELKSTIGRHIRDAKLLVPFSDNKILDAIPRAKRLAPEEWTLRTILKVLTK